MNGADRCSPPAKKTQANQIWFYRCATELEPVPQELKPAFIAIFFLTVGCLLRVSAENGQGGREHGQKRDQLPGQRSLADPAAREYVAGVWGIKPEELPQPGYSAQEIMNAIHSGEIKGLLSLCFNPLISLPDANFTREALSKLEYFGVVDFFLSETAHHADVVMAGSLHEEEDGLGCSAEGRVIHWKKSIDPPGDARCDSDIIIDLAHRLGRGQFFPFKNPADILEELRVASRGGVADYYGITYERVDQQMGIFWPCPSLDHPGTPRLFVDKKFYTHDGKAHFNVTEWRPSGDEVGEEYPSRREKPTNIFYFGSQKITTKVYMMAPAEREAIALDVVDYMWEEQNELVATGQ